MRDRAARAGGRAPDARAAASRPGAPFTLFNGTGGEFAAALGARRQEASRRESCAHDAVERESPLHITLLQGVARGERMDLIVQKATELGVTRIVPVLAERSVVKVDAKQRVRKREHWQAIAISACEQCGRNRVPEVSEPAALGDACRAAARRQPALPAGGGRARIRWPRPRRSMAREPIVLLIGPEGGLADNEREFARANGFTACRLGPRIMRTETAGLAALAVLQTVAGDFR